MSSISESTKNIIQFINKNTYNLLEVFNIYTTNNKKIKEPAESFLESILKLLSVLNIISLQNASNRAPEKVIAETKKWYTLMNEIYKNQKLSSEMRNVVKVLLTYLYVANKGLNQKINSFVESAFDTLNSAIDISHSEQNYKKRAIHKSKAKSKAKTKTKTKAHKKSRACSTSSTSSSCCTTTSSCSSTSSSTSTCSTTTSTCDTPCECDVSGSLCEQIQCIVDKRTEKEAITKSILQLSCIKDLFTMLKNILNILEKQYTDQLVYNSNQPETDNLTDTDTDYFNKILDMYASQMKTLSENHCGEIFSCSNDADTIELDPDTVEIKVTLSNDTELTLVEIDNICIYIEEDDKVSIKMGTKVVTINFITLTITYGDYSTSLQDLIEEVVELENIIDNNTRIVNDALYTVELLQKSISKCSC